MNKKVLIGTGLIIVLVVAVYLLVNHTNHNDDSARQSDTQSAASFDGRNSTFMIEGESVTLTNGLSEQTVADSAAKITTRYFGNEARGDLNGDGLEDQAFLVTQDGGGSGTFYYVVAALQTHTGYKTTNAVFIGDRIAPQSTEIHSDSGQLDVNYADRRVGEPMSAQPSEGKTLFLKVTSDGVLETI